MEETKIIDELNNRISISEGLLCGVMLKDLGLLGEYKISKELLSEDAKFYIGMATRLSSKGVDVIDEITFVTEVKDLGLYDKFQKLNGYSTIRELVNLVDVRNIEGIYDDWSKWNLIKIYHDKGIINIDVHWNKVQKMTAKQLIDYMDYMITNIDIEVTTDIQLETLDITNEEEMDILNGINLGVNFGKHSPILNYLTMGLPRSELTMFASYTNGGKSSYVMNSVVIPIAEQGTKVLVVANEQKSMAYKSLLLTYVLTERLNYWKLTRKKFKSGQWSDDDKNYIKQAKEIIKKEYSPYITFAKMYDYDMKKVSKLAKREAKKGCEVLIYDTMKYSGDDESTWMSLMKDSKDLLQICSKYNLAGVVTFQLYLGSKNKSRIIDESLLSNGKQVAEVFSEMIGWRDLWTDEYDGEDSAIKPYRLKKDENGKYTGQKEYISLTKDDAKNYKIFFHFKTRNDSVGTQLLYDFQGHQNKWIERGYCTATGKNRY